MRLGFYKIIRFFTKLLKNPVSNKNESEEILALKAGALRIKRETERSVISYFKDYKENIKFQYIFKLAEAASNSLYESLIMRLQAHVADLSSIVDMAGKNRIDAKQASDALTEMEETFRGINERISLLRDKIERINKDAQQ